MNTEEKVKQKQYEKKVFLDSASFHQELVKEFEAKADNIQKEIEDLSKPEESAPLTFLQLAEKYDRGLFAFFDDIVTEREVNVNIAEKYSDIMRNSLSISFSQARKFVAEIYLILLAKELDGELDWDLKKQRIVPTITNNNELNFIYLYTATPATLVFNSIQTYHKSLAYSKEAITMWNWYFGREEGK